METPDARPRQDAEPDIRLATRDDAPLVGRVLAEGFVDDPVMCWVFEEPHRTRTLGATFGFLAREALVPLGATYLAGMDCCASWTPPDAPGWPPDRGERFGALLEEHCTPEERDRFAALGAAIDEHRPTDRHWYLGSIATVPSARGAGLGGAILTRSLAPVDDDGLPAYLESTNPRNISLYLRHGFHVVGTIALPGCPAMTPMWRDPAVH